VLAGGDPGAVAGRVHAADAHLEVLARAHGEAFAAIVTT